MRRGAILLLAASLGYAQLLLRVYTPTKEDIQRFLALKAWDLVSVRPEVYLEFIGDEKDRDELLSLGFEVEVLIPDLLLHHQRVMAGLIDFGPYYTYDEMRAEIDKLHTRYPKIVAPPESIGTTHEGRAIWALKLSDNPKVEEGEPGVLYTGVHHAREPITCTICLEFARWLCENYGVDPVATYLVNSRELWFIPVLNPDGYVYNETFPSGMWRKNRRDNKNGTYGVDLNRNYPYRWGYDDIGSSPDPGSETYRGPSPASEPETRAVIELCKKHNFTCGVNYHSYSNLLLYPWGYAPIHTPDSLTFRVMAQDMTRVSGYEYGTPWELLYLANGTSDDWMYGSPGRPKTFAFTPEVGEWFWQPYEDVIAEQVRENLPLNLYAAKAAGSWLELVEAETGPVNPGDTIELSITLRNLNPRDRKALAEAVLRCRDGWVELLSAQTRLGEVGPQDTAEANFRFFCAPYAPAGRRIRFWLDWVNDRVYQSRDSFELTVGELPVVFFDDFESGPGKWIWTPPWGITNLSSYSPNHSATDSPLRNYGNRRNISLTLKDGIDLSQRRYALLSFWHRYHLEGGWDFILLEASTDGFVSWDTLARISGHQPEWRKVKYSLDRYLGEKNLKIRFRLVTDDWTTRDGWYLDDIAIIAPLGTNRPPGSPLPVSPTDNEAIDDPRPVLVVRNAADPDGDELSYNFRVYKDSLLTQLVASVDGVQSGPETTSWRVDRELSGGRYFWRACAADPSDRSEFSEPEPFRVTTGIAEGDHSRPKAYGLRLHPNPVRDLAVFELQLPRPTPASLKLYDASGRLVKRLIDSQTQSLEPGTYNLIWDGKDDQGQGLASGVYFYRLEAEGFNATGKAVVLR